MQPWVFIPNLISAFRLLLAMWFPFAPVEARPYILIAAGLSDSADGFIARYFHLTTWVGGLLDATADKLFALSVLITYTLGPELVWWEPILLLSRDVTVAMIALTAAGKRKWNAFRHMPARPLGKATTAVMFGFFLILAIFPDHLILIEIVYGLVLILSLAASVDYLRVFSLARTSPWRRTHA